MDFWLLPPEINSVRLYTGAGSFPLLAAAASWDSIAAELRDTAQLWRSVMAGVSATWTGPSSTAMLSAAATQIGWLASTALHAEKTAQQARAAARAFETARAATVHPALVAANRTQVAALAAANLLGQNTAAIATLEAQYGEMWAQDITAMADYQASSQQASTLEPFKPAPQTTNPRVLTAALLTALIGSSTPADLLNAYTQAFLSSGPYETPIAVLGLFSTLWAFTAPASPITQALTRITATATVPAAPATAASTAVIRASIGDTQHAGALSVPRTWWAQPPASTAPPAARPLPAAETDIPVPLPTPLPLPRGGTPPKQPRPQPEYGAHVRFVPRPPAGG